MESWNVISTLTFIFYCYVVCTFAVAQCAPPKLHWKHIGSGIHTALSGAEAKCLFLHLSDTLESGVRADKYFIVPSKYPSESIVLGFEFQLYEE